MERWCMITTCQSKEIQNKISEVSYFEYFIFLLLISSKTEWVINVIPKEGWQNIFTTSYVPPYRMSLHIFKKSLKDIFFKLVIFIPVCLWSKAAWTPGHEALKHMLTWSRCAVLKLNMYLSSTLDQGLSCCYCQLQGAWNDRHSLTHEFWTFLNRQKPLLRDTEF